MMNLVEVEKTLINELVGDVRVLALRDTSCALTDVLLTDGRVLVVRNDEHGLVYYYQDTVLCWEDFLPSVDVLEWAQARGLES